MLCSKSSTGLIYIYVLTPYCLLQKIPSYSLFCLPNPSLLSWPSKPPWELTHSLPSSWSAIEWPPGGGVGGISVGGISDGSDEGTCGTQLWSWDGEKHEHTGRWAMPEPMYFMGQLSYPGYLYTGHITCLPLELNPCISWEEKLPVQSVIQSPNFLQEYRTAGSSSQPLQMLLQWFESKTVSPEV